MNVNLTKASVNSNILMELALQGFNVMRLPVSWAATTPVLDNRSQWSTVDATYLKSLATIVRTVTNKGIYVVLDMHQNVLTSVSGASTFDGPTAFHSLVCIEQFQVPGSLSTIL